MKILSKILSFFFNTEQYGPYTLHSEKTYKVPVKKEIPDPKLSFHTDPRDFIMVETGEYKTVTEETWVAYGLKTNLPNYRIITR
jgi:hypothetical protein